MRAAKRTGYTYKTLIVGDDGTLEAGTRVTVSGGTAGLINLFAPPINIEMLDSGETTGVGFMKVGTSLRQAMSAARVRFGR